MSHTFEDTIVGELVAADYRAADVFGRFGIDFCCGGSRSVADACKAAAVDPHTVERALHDLSARDDGEREDAAHWPLDRLIDHIVTTHHAYTRSALMAIGHHLTKLVDVHGTRHPELTRIRATWDRLAVDLMHHMMKEERVLFPYIRELAFAPSRRLTSPFGSVENPIRMMEREHENAGDDLRTIRELSNGYTAPADGCATYRLCFEELAQFERDLHRHVHLENNVLFPKAVTLERRS